MSGLTDTIELAALRTILLNGTYDWPTTVYLGYAKTASTEATDANYVRQSIAFSTPVSGSTSNSATITFPAVAATHNAVQLACFTAATSGAQITDWKALTAGTVSLVTAQQLRVTPGSYKVICE